MSAGSRRIARGHIRIEQLTALALLTTPELMGVARYDAVARRSPRFQCRTEPWRDDDLSRMRPSFRLIAWCINYAHCSVIVASPGWRPCEDVAAFARARRIGIRTASSSTFPRAKWRR